MKRFVVNIFLISVILVIIGWVIFSMFIPQYYLPVFPFVLMFFAVSSVAVHAYQLQLSKKDTARFTRSNMIITFLKLFLYSAVAIVYIAVDTQNAKIFVICFILLYIIFSVFEVLSLMKIPVNNITKR